MSTLKVTKEDGAVEEFQDVIGHQVGNGAVQVMLEDGTQHVFNNFKEVFVDLDEEDKAAFKARMDDAKRAPIKDIDAPVPPLKTVN